MWKMTSVTKPEAHNVSQRRQRRTKPGPQSTYNNNFGNFRCVVFRVMRSHRQTDRQTVKTDILIATYCGKRYCEWHACLYVSQQCKTDVPSIKSLQVTNYVYVYSCFERLKRFMPLRKKRFWRYLFSLPKCRALTNMVIVIGLRSSNSAIFSEQRSIVEVMHFCVVETSKIRRRNVRTALMEYWPYGQLHCQQRQIRCYCWGHS